MGTKWSHLVFRFTDYEGKFRRCTNWLRQLQILSQEFRKCYVLFEIGLEFSMDIREYSRTR